MRRVRVIPVLLLKNGGVVKTVRFQNPVYIGDPINTVKIFNEKEVDELLILDIAATREKRQPSMEKVAELASESFMPVGYGGGISNVGQVEAILSVGIEKAIINSAAVSHSGLVYEAAQKFGSQSIVISVDVRRNLLGKYRVTTVSGSKNTGLDPVMHAKMMESNGAGEIMINAVDRDGTFSGYDLGLIKRIAEAVGIPVIACGGARHIGDFVEAVNSAGASAVAAGSMFVFHGKKRGILISYPPQQTLREELFSRVV
jgi:imidazole glycerol-phosphate synthase subunit HisF